MKAPQPSPLPQEREKQTEQRGFVVTVIGRMPVRFIEPATMVKKFAIANDLGTATRFETKEQAIIRARQELTPSTFNVREVGDRGGWHYVEDAVKETARLKPAWAVEKAKARKARR